MPYFIKFLLKITCGLKMLSLVWVHSLIGKNTLDLMEMLHCIILIVNKYLHFIQNRRHLYFTRLWNVWIPTRVKLAKWLNWGNYLEVLGARVRHSARGKGHEEGGSTFAKAGSNLRSPPGNPQASTPITRACLLYYFVLPPTPLTLWGLSPTTSFGEGVNLDLQLIKTPGHDMSVLTYTLLWRFSSLPDRFVRPHVSAHSLPTVRGTRCFKPSKNRFLRKVRKLLV